MKEKKIKDGIDVFLDWIYSGDKLPEGEEWRRQKEKIPKKN